MQRHTNTQKHPDVTMTTQTKADKHSTAVEDDLPHWDVHYQERSCHRQSDVGRCTARSGRYRRLPGCHCHGECPGQWLDDRLASSQELKQVFQPSTLMDSHICSKMITNPQNVRTKHNQNVESRVWKDFPCQQQMCFNPKKLFDEAGTN